MSDTEAQGNYIAGIPDATPTEVLAQADTPTQETHIDDAGGYSRVSPEKAVQIARLKRDNPKLTQQEIAHVVGVHHSTVSRWLSALGDNTVPEARNLMKSQALPAAMGIVDQTEHTDPRVRQGALKAVLALAGVAETTPQVQVGVQVVVGQVGQPAGDDPFEAQIMVNSTPAIEP